MGQRANLFVIEGGQLSNHYTHWSANVITPSLLWGPQRARSWILAHQQIAHDDLLDWVWAEGFVVLDLDRQVLLFDGDELQVWQRRLEVELFRLTWPGWTVRWGSRGLDDLLRYLGMSFDSCDPPALPGATTVGPPGHADLDAWLDHDGMDEDPWHVVSVRDEAGVRWAGAYVESTRDVVALPADRFRGLVHRPFRPGPGTASGVHVDLLDRWFGVWQIHGVLGSRTTVQAQGPGWQLRRWGDRFEEHERALGGTTLVTRPTPESAAADCAELRRQALTERVNPIDAVVEKLGGQVPITVSPWAAMPVLQAATADDGAVFDAILRAWWVDRADPGDRGDEGDEGDRGDRGGQGHRGDPAAYPAPVPTYDPNRDGVAAPWTPLDP